MKYKEVSVIQWTTDNLDEVKEFLGNNFIALDVDNYLFYKHSQESEDIDIIKPTEFIYKNENYFDRVYDFLGRYPTI